MIPLALGASANHYPATVLCFCARIERMRRPKETNHWRYRPLRAYRLGFETKRNHPRHYGHSGQAIEHNPPIRFPEKPSVRQPKDLRWIFRQPGAAKSMITKHLVRSIGAAEVDSWCLRCTKPLSEHRSYAGTTSRRVRLSIIRSYLYVSRILIPPEWWYFLIWVQPHSVYVPSL